MLDTIGNWISQQFASISASEIIVALVCGFVTGLLIAFIYKRTYRGVLYSPSFALTLIMMTLITTPVTAAIRSSVALSMGMVGALSIVRFRTAVKDPLDTAYMFWAITMGILLGAGLYLIALVVVIVISLVMILLFFFKLRNPDSYLLVVHCSEFAETAIETAIRRFTKDWHVRSKTMSRGGLEMTIEVRLDEKRLNIVSFIMDIEGVSDATLVACQTEAGA
ncbi:MAG: DUF4956 domain-containing protein [Clostridiales bacterium]|nr:DUF4956 domain-containing protein [Clostridiales bacterium]